MKFFNKFLVSLLLFAFGITCVYAAEITKFSKGFKKAFKDYYKDGIFSEVSKDVIRPSAEECVRNPRAKSTKMRWAVKS